jgi:hypothetical protein
MKCEHIFVAGVFSRLRLMFETTRECFGDILLEVHARILSDDFIPQDIWEGFIANAKPDLLLGFDSRIFD